MTMILVWVVAFAAINAAAWIFNPKNIKFRRYTFIASFFLASIVAWFLANSGG